MSKQALVAIALLLTPLAGFCQDKVPIHKIRLGGIKNSTTIYKGSRPGVKEMKTSYKDILDNPRLICETDDCIVTHFTLTIVPKGSDLHGPYSTDGAELKENVKTHLTKLSDAGDHSAKIVVEDITVKHGNKTESVKGTLYYTIK